MKAKDLVIITKLCKNCAKDLELLLAVQKFMDARLEHNKALENLSSKSLQDVYGINYGNEMLKNN